MTAKRILYLVGGRSVLGNDPGRKITAIIDCWRGSGFSVKAVFGGDIEGGSAARGAKDYGNISFYRQWYRRYGILDPLIRTVSERRDILHDAAMVRHMEQVCESFKPNVIWERSCRLHCAGLLTARRLDVPYVLEWKDNIASYWLSWYRNRAREMERRKNKEADFIVAESEVLRTNLIREGIDENKILVAQNAVDSRHFRRNPDAGQRIRSELGIAHDTVLIGYLGSYAWYHDTGRLVMAMDLLRKCGGANVRCLMVGAGKEYDATRKLAEKHGLLGGEIIMKPAVPKDEVPGILAALDIAVLPGSTDIICPIKIQEYMACELPSVIPNYACNREVLRDGETGAFFKPKDETSLAGKISLLSADRLLRLRMGRQAREDVERLFTWEKTWGSALETVLNAKRQNEPVRQ